MAYESVEVLRRYTDLPALFYMLRHHKITLLDPASWDDSNDAYYLLKYKERKNLKCVLALCMTRAEESYHHWKIFSQGPAGVCISFSRDKLICSMQSVAGLTVKEVKYRRLRDARRQVAPPRVVDLPFLKRGAFEAEEEVRAIFESDCEELRFLDVDLDLCSVLNISLSPWLHDRLKNPTKEAIHSIPGCECLHVHRSTLVGNTEWKRLGDAAI